MKYLPRYERYTGRCAGLDQMNGALPLTDALEGLNTYNTHIDGLERLQDERLGTRSGQGEAAAFSKVVRSAPKIVSSTFQAAQDKRLRIAAQATGEENVEFFFSLTTGLASGHGSLTAADYVLYANTAAWQTLARNPASQSYFTADDQTIYNRAYQRSCLAPAAVVERLPLPIFSRRRRAVAAQIQEDLGLLRRATSKLALRRLGRVSQQRRAPLSTIPVPASVTLGADLDVDDIIIEATEIQDDGGEGSAQVNDEGGAPATAVGEGDDESAEDSAMTALLPCVYAGSLVVLCPSHRQDGSFWLGVTQDTVSAGDTQVTIKFCETLDVHAAPPDVITYDVKDSNAVVPYTSIIALADQRALYEDTVTISRATYMAYAKLGCDAVAKLRTQRQKRRAAELRSASRQSHQNQSELWRPHSKTRRKAPGHSRESAT